MSDTVKKIEVRESNQTFLKGDRPQLRDGIPAGRRGTVQQVAHDAQRAVMRAVGHRRLGDYLTRAVDLALDVPSDEESWTESYPNRTGDPLEDAVTELRAVRAELEASRQREATQARTIESYQEQVHKAELSEWATRTDQKIVLENKITAQQATIDALREEIDRRDARLADLERMNEEGFKPTGNFFTDLLTGSRLIAQQGERIEELEEALFKARGACKRLREERDEARGAIADLKAQVGRLQNAVKHHASGRAIAMKHAQGLSLPQYKELEDALQQGAGLHPRDLEGELVAKDNTIARYREDVEAARKEVREARRFREDATMTIGMLKEEIDRLTDDNRALAESCDRLAQERDEARGAIADLEAMEREPLEDVIHDLSPGTKICHVWPLLEGGYEAEIGVPVRQHPDGWWDHERSRGEGATIDEAIRNAVAAAKGSAA